MPMPGTGEDRFSIQGNFAPNLELSLFMVESMLGTNPLSSNELPTAGFESGPVRGLLRSSTSTAPISSPIFPSPLPISKQSHRSPSPRRWHSSAAPLCASRRKKV